MMRPVRVDRLMRALVLDPSGTLTLAERPRPSIPSDCVIRVVAAGICGTDLELRRGYAGFSGVPGHEFVGVVEEAPPADADWIGRRVTGGRQHLEPLYSADGAETIRRALGYERHVTLARVGKSLIVRAATPVVDDAFQLRGAVVLSVPLDSTFADRLKAQLSADVVVYKELRIVGALGVDVDAYRAALDLLASGRWPFADLPRAVAPFDTLEDLLRLLAGESEGVPPVHAVFVPSGEEATRS